MPTAAPTPRTVPKHETDVSLAPRWRVLIHNDPVTTMDFVIQVLAEVFKLGLTDATSIMLEAHRSGVALVVVETREQAEFHIDQAHSMARGSGYPLTFSMEPEE